VFRALGRTCTLVKRTRQLSLLMHSTTLSRNSHRQTYVSKSSMSCCSYKDPLLCVRPLNLVEMVQNLMSTFLVQLYLAFHMHRTCPSSLVGSKGGCSMYYCANVQHAARLVELFSVEPILPKFNGSACRGRICKLNEYFTDIHSDTRVPCVTDVHDVTGLIHGHGCRG